MVAEYTGRVEDIEVGAVTKERLYKVRYLDGDMMHMTEQQVRALHITKAPHVAEYDTSDEDEEESPQGIGGNMADRRKRQGRKDGTRKDIEHDQAGMPKRVSRKMESTGPQ